MKTALQHRVSILLQRKGEEKKQSQLRQEQTLALMVPEHRDVFERMIEK